MTRCRGFTLVEALAGLMVGSLVLSVLMLLMQPAIDQTTRTPEQVDLAERARAAEAVLRSTLQDAGAGADLLGHGGLTDVVPAVWPRRLGQWAADPEGSAWPDRLTLVTVPWLAAQAPVADAVPSGAGVVSIAPHAACGTDARCGFRVGDHVALLEPRTGVEFARVTAADPGQVVRTPGAAALVPLPALLARVEMTVLYFDAARRQLRRYDGLANDQPVIDDVVWMAVRYYADPLPPTRPALPGESTCVVGSDGVALLPLLGPVPAPLVELTASEVVDGPWCGHAPWRFDADLLRVRAVRVRLRLQASAGAVRGTGPAFLMPGTAERAGLHVRDVELDVFVSPRGLAGG